MISKLARPVENDGTAPWRKGIPDAFKKQVAGKVSFAVPLLIDYLSSGNKAMQAIVAQHIQRYGQLEAIKNRSNYDLQLVQCTDSRHATIHPNLLLESHHIIHKRFAGNVTTKGTGLRNVSASGTIVVEGHEACGACKAAHDHEESLKPGDAKITMDPSIYRIISSIPPHVRNMGDDNERVKANAVVQAFYAHQILSDLYGRPDMKVCPAFYSWTSGYKWLGSPKSGNLPPRWFQDGLSSDAQLMTRYAIAEGRKFDTQYAALTMLYDPYRLGRVNDPRAIFGALGNEMFCVTADLRVFDPGFAEHLLKTHHDPQKLEKRLATPTLGSIMYAGYEVSGGHFGHVSGVGGTSGTHILGIMDASKDVIAAVKSYFLENFPVIKELTENGKRILPILYDPATVKATFLPP